MTPETLALFAGSLLSILFSVVPILKPWYEGLTGLSKRLVMAGVLLLASVVIYAAACLSFLNIILPGASITCTEEGIWSLAQVFLLAVVANQATFILTKKQ